VSTHRRKLDNQQLISRLGGHARWGKCEDRTEGTAKPRAQFMKKFMVQAGGDPAVRFEDQPKQIKQRAESLRKSAFHQVGAEKRQGPGSTQSNRSRR
jgi:hypothetical protein